MPSAFFSSPAAGGIVLIIASAAAIIVANSPLREGYEVFLKYNAAGLSVEHWINDALMAVFFMMVGLEIKRELLTGQLATWGQRQFLPPRTLPLRSGYWHCWAVAYLPR